MQLDLEFMADLKWVKDRSQESFYRERAISVFGIYLRKGTDATEWIADLLWEKAEEGLVSKDEMQQVLTADLLWSAETRQTEAKVVLVMEASWYAESTDIDQAAACAKILQRIGVLAIPVVGGHEWDDATRQKAIEQSVVATINRCVDKAS